MTRLKTSPLVFVGVLAVAGVGTLLWCAWLILTAPLPRGATAAAWTLWLLSVAALVTVVAYLREMVRHGDLRRRASWKPLPGLVLLWLAGLTAMVAFPFVLPERTAGPTDEATADPVQPAVPTTGSLTPSRTEPTVASRSTRTIASASTRSPRTTPSTGAATATNAVPSPTKTPVPTTTTPSSTSSTSTPILGVTLPIAPGRPTDKPPPPGHH